MSDALSTKMEVVKNHETDLLWLDLPEGYLMRKTLVFCLLILPLVLFANPAFATQNKTITKTYRYIAGDKIPDILEEFAQDGIVYRLLSPIGLPKVSSSFVLSREYSTTERKDGIDFTLVKDDRYQDTFATTIKISEDGYIGIMTRQGFDLLPYYQPRKRQVERTVTYPDLSSNDVSSIPQVRTFTITSDVGDDTKTTEELGLAALEWTIDEVDSYGIPLTWTAIATYRGIEGYRTGEDYTVVAHYEGIATRPGSNMTIEAVYEAQGETTAPDSPAIPEDQTPLQEDKDKPTRNWLTALLAALASATLVIIIAFLLSPNARITDQDQQTIKRMRLKRRDKSLMTYQVNPALFERLYPSNDYYLIPKKSLISPEMALYVTTITVSGTHELFDAKMRERNLLDIDTLDEGSTKDE
jgi:hypothetical protein